MGDRSKIEWTDATWNPIVGCSRVSPGCDHCYAIGVVHRQMSEQHRGLTVVTDDGVDWNGKINVVEHLLDQPLRWRKPRRIFVNSLSDLFHPDVDIATIARVFAVMAEAQHHTFQVLTKRPQRMAAVLADVNFWGHFWASGIHDRTGLHVGNIPFPNIHLGVSIESNRYAFRADHLRDTPAAVRWVSAEPLLGPLDQLDLTGIDWVVTGGESGPGSRPMHPDWVRHLRDCCHPEPFDVTDPVLDAPDSAVIDLNGTTFERVGDQWQPRSGPAFHFKQWGDWMPYADALDVLGHDDDVFRRAQREAEAGCLSVVNMIDPTDPGAMIRVGKKLAGRVLDGRTWDEYPT